MLSKEEIEKDDNYWKGYVQKQKEAQQICKQCKYRKQARKLETDKQKLIEKLEKNIKNIDKLLDEMMTDMGDGIKIINLTGLTRKEKEEVVNKRNCLLVQKYCYEEILKILKGEANE